MATPEADAPFSLPRGRAVPFRRIALGYLAACASATILLPVLLFVRDAAALGPTAAFAAVVPADLLSIELIGFCLVCVFAAPFATALIVLTQTLGLRQMPVFAAGGGLIGPLVGGIAALMPAVADAPSAIVWGSFVIYAVLGIVAGLVYWSVAVRRPSSR